MLPRLVRALDHGIAVATGRRYPAYAREIHAMERWPRPELEAWQRRKLAALLDHARARVPYWRKTLRASGEELAHPERFCEIPFLTKELIQQEGDALVDTGPSRGRVTRSSTGGSTGRNIWFLLDMETNDRRRAAALLTDTWEDVRPGTRTVTLWGSPLDAHPSRLSRTYDALANRLLLSAYRLDEAAVESHCQRLRAFRPEIVISYPSILAHFARRMGKDRCRALALRRIFTSAEALFPSIRLELEDLFGCPVRNRYASREFGMIAAQCPVGERLHVMDPRFLIESVSQDGAPPELVVTDLDNRLQPFIRYRIQDAARVVPDPCPCGRPFTLLESVEGRSLDVIATPSGRAFGGTFFTLVLRPSDRAVEQFQVVQEAADRVRVLVVKGPGWTDARGAEIQATLERELQGMTCRIESVQQIPELSSGKRRFVVGWTGTPPR
jgi:phenylacetate-CoA ligase